MQYCQNCAAPLNKREIDGRKRDVCDNCGAIYYEQWKVSAGVCVVKDGRLLLIQRGINPWKGCWHMPAGYVEVGEDPCKAAEREALEETGLTVKVESLVNVYCDYEDPRGNVLVLIYNARIMGGELSITKETLNYGFFTPAEISSLPLAGLCARQTIFDWIEHLEVRYE